MDLRTKIVTLIWLGMLGFLGFYVYGLVLGVFSPFELVGFTVMAVVFAVLFMFHARRTRRAIHDESHPSHDEMARTARRQLEKRGF
jgi:mannose/fructose/N-acetylgalactosamine-specific phosphotransferase system component IIC